MVMAAAKGKEAWLALISAIEEIAPCYDGVNERISFWQAGRARRYLARDSRVLPDMVVADVGVGPGSMSKEILSRFKPSALVALDVSRKMLESALRNLSGFDGTEVLAVRCAFEHLPFRDSVFDRVFASFALQDSRFKRLAVEEFRRVCKEGGLLLLANVGKPDNRALRLAMSFYMRFLMPIAAKTAALGKVAGNPWRLLAKVFQDLPTNSSLKNLVAGIFGEASMKEFMFGGVVAIIARKRAFAARAARP
ncbi:TPA: methyltransferase domain-containing protein [Candidatus Bathyarchaeota archaeon]|nr:methyltransferase domain-containing protein [Candidatus Bathyarchaeota archaeon]